MNIELDIFIQGTCSKDNSEDGTCYFSQSIHFVFNDLIGIKDALEQSRMLLVVNLW